MTAVSVTDVRTGISGFLAMLGCNGERGERRTDVPAGLRFALSLTCLVTGATPAYAGKFLFSRAADGLSSLNVSGGQGFENTTVSLFCKPSANEYYVALVSPEIGMPREDVDVTLKAGGKALGTYRFVPEEEALILIIDSTKGRALVERASGVSSLAATLSGRRVTFALSEGASHVKAFRKACGFSPA